MIEEILEGSAHVISLFTSEELAAVDKMIYDKNGRNARFMRCQIRGKEIQLKPEEVVRQLFIYRLIHTYGYDAAQIKVEHGIHFGREVKRADIVIFEKSRPNVEYIIVEVKKPKLKDGKEQLRSYCNATGATMGVWTNGNSISFYHRKDPNYFEDIHDIPCASQKLKDILTQRWTLADLVEKDRLVTENKTLSELVVEMEDEVLANAGVDVFEEVFKLIFTKLYDEKMSTIEPGRALEFRNYGETDADLKDTVQNLFDAAKEKWAGVFTPEDKIKLAPSHLAICISSLQNVKLFNSNLEIIDEAFEYLMSKSQKGEKGQYFTPRYVIDMCVKMLNPKITETMIDTAAGSCGFPVHTIFHVCGSQFTAKNKSAAHTSYVEKKVFAIDFDEKAVRVARTLNLIAGDGKTNVLWLNTLDYDRWDESVKDEDWQNIYMAGWIKLRALRAEKKSDRDFLFDIVMANPPFAGDIKETRVLHKYDLAKNSAGKYQSKVGRDILFIERNLQFLKPGGRMAIVLPQGRFNNSSDKYIRDFIAERCRILAVVGLHGNVFKPHTGTKTSVLFVQKWDDTLCPRRDDYPIFFATMQKPSKDNSGDKIYVTDASGNFLRDAHNHQIVDHDLFNHEGLTGDGIAEAFIEFAKREHLSFFDPGSFDESKYRQLLEELECTEILLSKLENEFTIGAEYYAKKYINAMDKVIRHNYKSLQKISEIITDGDHGEPHYTKSGVLYLLSESVECGYVIRSKCRYISTAKNSELRRSCLHYGDVVLTKTGVYFGKSAVIPPEIIEANTSSHVSKISLKSGYNPWFVSTFLNSDYGYFQVRRRGIKATRPEVTLKEIGDVLVPIFSGEFDKTIENVVWRAWEFMRRSTETYRAAEQTLAQALHLDTFTPSTQNIAVKSFSESFGQSGRLDAEYYQPKYDDLQKFLADLPTAKLADVVNIFKSIEPGSDFYSTEGVPFIRVSDVNKFGISEPEIRLAGNWDVNYFPRKDTVLFSKDGSVGIAYKVREDLAAVTSGALLHLTVKNPARILPDYLALALNSKIVKLQAERDSNGAIIQHWRIEDIKNLVVPIAEFAVQEKISAMVSESFSLRAESERLLEVAKAAVELAIERGEAAAVAFVEGNLYNAGVEKI